MAKKIHDNAFAVSLRRNYANTVVALSCIFKVMLHEPTFNATLLRLKLSPVIFCCGNILQVFESLEKPCNMFGQILLELVRETPPQLTVNAYRPRMHHEEPK